MRQFLELKLKRFSLNLSSLKSPKWRRLVASGRGENLDTLCFENQQKDKDNCEQCRSCEL